MSKFYQEVCEQPKAIRETVQKNQSMVIEKDKPFLFTGMGSSLVASKLAAEYLNANGIDAMAVDNSELLYYYPTKFFEQFHVFVISQSGESYEAVELAKKYDSVTAVTSSPDSTLAKLVERNLYIHSRKEEAIASSKSFTSTAVLLLLLASKIVGTDLTKQLYDAADILEQQFKQADEYKRKIGQFLDANKPLILIGRGPSVCTAQQGALTLKETARMFTEGTSAPQFRHGPFELIKENLQSIFFNPKGITYEINKNYVLEMANLGAKVLYISEEELVHDNILSIIIPSTDEYASVTIYSYITQLAAVELSSQKGLVAGEAELISKITGRE
ncbi:SIS domain-containing protein [Terrilactibacillus laevilacticus]|uniref:Glutamine--fructose-6-phosphate aminotransferase [isomerizing] n=1 Tax=Terrilactibacillus laevilacticus TaxID=1380157 RepID=A0ABW5PSA4_9BACI|nr:SIS domain-containing protein [Terrilactibacillus laevilacticus]